MNVPRRNPVPKQDTADERVSALEARIAALELRDVQVTTALAAARMGIWDANLTAQLVSVSESMVTMLGVDPRKLPRTFEEFYLSVHPDDRSIVQEAREKVELEGDGASFEAEFRTLFCDGTTRWNAVRAQAYSDPADGSSRLRGVMTDISGRKSLEAQLRQAQKMDAVGKLAGGVAHDFNNLLTTILGYSTLVLDTLNDGDRRKDDILEVIGAGNRAVSLTTQLLAFSRKQVLQFTSVDLNSLVSETWAILKSLIGENVDLVADFAEDLGAVRADRGQVEHILKHLVMNARDALPSGGTITIATSQIHLDQSFMQDVVITPGPYVMVSVSDNGTGMTAEVKRRLFEPFFTTKGQSKGTGLGLATVYGIVKQSGGYIWVTSDVGSGSRFDVYLPLETRAPSERRGDGGDRNLTGTERILLVEDDNAVRFLTRRMLEKAGYTVFDALDPHEAALMFEENPDLFDILVTDVIMPGESGPDLYERLSSLRPGLKVVYVSGFTNDIVAGRGQLGPDFEFLQKPFTAESLTRRVREVLDS